MTRKAANHSLSHLQIELFEDNSKVCLACICGPGFQRKQFWVQQPEVDVLSIQKSDDCRWLHMVVATGLVAAKTQRHRDKITDRSRRSGHGFI